MKILFAILSVDIHNRAALVLCQAFRDAGMEVIYPGYGLTPSMLASIAEQEDPDVICLSSHQGFHTQLFPVLMEELKQRGLTIPVVAGGSIPDKDKPLLEGMGISGNFGPGTPLPVIIDHVRKRAHEKQDSAKDL